MVVRIFLSLLFTLNVFAGISQVRADSLFKKSALLADLDSLREAILLSHPDPAAFCGMKTFEAAFLQEKNALDSLTVLRDFTANLARCINAMKDSHTTVDYSQLQNMQLLDSGRYVPLSLKPISRMDGGEKFDVVVSGYWTAGIPKGSRLLYINGMDVMDIYAHALDYACVEGSSEGSRKTIATALIPVIAGVCNAYTDHNIYQFRKPGSEEITVLDVPGYKRKEFDKLRRDKEKNDSSWIPKLKIENEGSIATLQIGTFAPNKGNVYARKIRRYFKQVNKAGIDNFVIDIRGNGGGSSAWVEYLYSFLDEKGYNTPSNVIGKNSELALNRNKVFHKSFVQFIVGIFYKNNEDVQSYKYFSSLPMGEQDTVYFKKPKVQKASNIYKGNCFLMINGLTASAGVDFTNAFKTRHRGLIIGEQCLGPTSGTWGNPAHYTLPNTQLKVTIATIRYNYDDTFRYEKNAIEPDYHVEFIDSDLAKEVDTQFEFIKKLIEEKK